MTPNTQIQERGEEAQPTTLIAEPTSLIRERREVLLGLYQENRTHLCHYEGQRSTVANMILLTTVGLIGLVKELTYKDWPLVLAMILVGLFGAAFSANQNWQIGRYKARSRKYDEALDELLFKGTATLKSIREVADVKTNPELSRLRKITQSPLIRTLWPLAISIVAAGFMVYMYFCLPHNN